MFNPLLPKESKESLEAFKKGITSVLDIISPSAVVVTPTYLQIGEMYCQTLYVYAYPRYLQTNWLFPIINTDMTFNISLFIYPQPTPQVMETLKKQVGRLESTRNIEAEKGQVRDPELETAISDVEELRDVLQKGELRLFHLALYFTIYAPSLEELKNTVKQIESILAGQLIYTKSALLRTEQGFNSTLPIFDDELGIVKNLDTGSLSTTLPFISSTLSTNSGILYGLNRHNNSLILFDRFELENANMCVFAKSGAGKSYAVKLESLRSLMLGKDIIVIDPENEYKPLAESVGGTSLSLSLNSPERINPFDLPVVYDRSESGEEILRSAIVTLHGLLRLMIGELTPEEDSILDKALFETYALKDISSDPATHKNPPPTLSDLANVLSNMPGAGSILSRLQKYTEGTFAGLLNRQTNITLKPGFTVFSIRDLEEQLRPIAMYLVLTYIWNIIRFDPKERILVIDEAWWMMQYEDTARFLYGLAKRARKYKLGLTVISQDVEDFLTSRYGKVVVSNSSMQLLLKQSPASIEVVADTFNLTEGEKYLLLESDIGEGLLFAGSNHVAIRVIASFIEDKIINGDLSFLNQPPL